MREVALKYMHILVQTKSKVANRTSTCKLLIMHDSCRAQLCSCATRYIIAAHDNNTRDMHGMATLKM
jgi:hypothetical protein